MKKILLNKYLVLPAILLFLGIIFVIKFTSSVKAGCASGYHCVGTTIFDKKAGCKSNCSQDYIRFGLIGCNSSCGYSADGAVDCRSGCRESSPYTQTTNCCAADEGSSEGGGCTTSAPTNLSLTKIGSAKSWTLSWTPGSGSSQHVYVGSNKVAVESNCPAGVGLDTGCVIKDETVAASTSTYTITNLSGGTIYYSRIVAYNDDSCNSPSGTAISLSSCDISPSSLSIEIGQSSVLSSQVSSSSEIGSVSYSKSLGYINLNPSSDNSHPYSTNVTGVSTGIGATVTNTVLSSLGVPLCSSNSTITVLNPGPWWQSVDGDITTNGNLLDGIPFVGSLYMSEKGPGGYPGIPVYGGTTDVASDKISETGWIANTLTKTSKIFNSTFFFSSIPQDVKPTQILSSTENGTTFTTLGEEKYGYYWYEYDSTLAAGADLTLTGPINLGSRKVILLVKNANVSIQGNINLTNGSGFFMMIVSKDSNGNGGNINVSPTVGGGITPNLKGIYVADNQFTTGVAATQLYIRGTVAAYGGVSLERDLGGPTNATTPAEVFEYAPELELLYPSKLGTRAINWQEVAP